LTHMKQAKAAFLARYNRDSSEEIALTSGLKAATQHNYLYRPGILRPPIRRLWKQHLRQLAGAYVVPMTLAHYENDICQLQRIMNEAFNGSFCEIGFRLSHAQKSLSVVLKHLWCMGRLAEPPACPIDRVVLGKVCGGRLQPWTRVNSLTEHREMFNKVLSAATHAGKSVAQWELLTFAPRSAGRDDSRSALLGRLSRPPSFDPLDAADLGGVELRRQLLDPPATFDLIS